MNGCFGGILETTLTEALLLRQLPCHILTAHRKGVQYSPWGVYQESVLIMGAPGQPQRQRGTSSKETPLAPSSNTFDPGSQPNIVASHSGQLKVSQSFANPTQTQSGKGGGCTHLGLKTSQNVECPLLRRLKTFALSGFSPGHSFGKVASCIAVELREWPLFLTLRGGGKCLYCATWWRVHLAGGG